MHAISYTDAWERRSRNVPSLPFSCETTLDFSIRHAEVPADIRPEIADSFFPVDPSADTLGTIQLDVTIAYDCDRYGISDARLETTDFGFSREANAWIATKFQDAIDDGDAHEALTTHAFEEGNGCNFSEADEWGTH